MSEPLYRMSSAGSHVYNIREKTACRKEAQSRVALNPTGCPPSSSSFLSELFTPAGAYNNNKARVGNERKRKEKTHVKKRIVLGH